MNTLWRRLAAEGHLAQAWPTLEGHTAATRTRADAVQDLAYRTATQLRWPVVAGPAALDSAAIADAAPGIRTMLDVYIKTLPRVLVLIADLPGRPADRLNQPG